MGQVMFDHGRYTDVTRERITELAQDDYDNDVTPPSSGHTPPSRARTC